MKDLVLPCYAALRPLFEQHSPDEYYKYIFQFDMDVFRRRVEMAGILGCQEVLDAGSGYGQWSVALSERNARVTAFDRDPGMVEIARALCAHYHARNVVVEQHDLNEEIPYPDASFDAVWCWGVIMFVHREIALREFRRVLRPGGKLVLGAVNSYGRWLYKLLTALNPRAFDPGVARMALRTLVSGHKRGAFPSLLSIRGASKYLASHGFEVQDVAPDGHIDVSGKGRRVSIFPPRFAGLESNIEVLAVKRG